VRAKPRSGRDGVEGIATEADGQAWLVVRVRAAAEGGKANQAVVAVIAAALGVARSAVTLLSGQAARRKRLRIEGEPARIVAALEKLGS
jgi:uncharacterized protein YggU (UPF0235/DUF167 family)